MNTQIVPSNITKIFGEQIASRATKQSWVQADSAGTVIAMAEEYAAIISGIDIAEMEADSAAPGKPEARAAARNSALLEFSHLVHRLANPSQFRQELAKARNWPKESKTTTTAYDITDIIAGKA